MQPVATPFSFFPGQAGESPDFSLPCLQYSCSMAVAAPPGSTAMSRVSTSTASYRLKSGIAIWRVMLCPCELVLLGSDPGRSAQSGFSNSGHVGIIPPGDDAIAFDFVDTHQRQAADLAAVSALENVQPLCQDAVSIDSISMRTVAMPMDFSSSSIIPMASSMPVVEEVSTLVQTVSEVNQRLAAERPTSSTKASQKSDTISRRVGPWHSSFCRERNDRSSTIR